MILRRRGRAARIACVSGALALAGCTESLVGVEAGFHGGDPFRIIASRPDGDSLYLTVRPKVVETSGRIYYAKPDNAILKLAGFMPILPLEVAEDGDSFRVRFKLPKDTVRAVNRFEAGTASIRGQLILPMEIGEVAFTGLEHRTYGAAFASTELRPQHSGPLTNLGRRAGDFLHGLYGAH